MSRKISKAKRAHLMARCDKIFAGAQYDAHIQAILRRPEFRVVLNDTMSKMVRLAAGAFAQLSFDARWFSSKIAQALACLQTKVTP